MADRDLTDPLAYEYVGGGYFRLKGVPRGQRGHAIHGEEYMKLVRATVGRLKDEVQRQDELLAQYEAS